MSFANSTTWPALGPDADYVNEMAGGWASAGASPSDSTSSKGEGTGTMCDVSFEVVTDFDLVVGVFATTVLCIVGALGNLAALAVLMRAQTGSRSSVRSMFPILRALSACDIAFLLVLIPGQVP